MDLAERLHNPAWLITALLLLGMILFMVIQRLLEARGVGAKFPRKRIVLTSFAATFYGLASQPGGPRRTVGVLVLLQDGLYFKARVSHHELSIPFRNPAGEVDTAAFRFLQPGRWVSAIKATLIEGRTGGTAGPLA
jgi:hypothetical protein